MISLNGGRLTFETFPNGETRVDGARLLELANEACNVVGLKYENDGDLLKLLFVKDFLDDRRLPATLAIGYMPYSRMDRVEGCSVFTLKSVARMINAMRFERVEVIEPHSDVTMALLDRSVARYPTAELLERVMEMTAFDAAADCLFFPDAGAQKRYSKLKGFRQLVGFKARDFATGEIQRLDVVGDPGEPGFKAIIVDDLCAYGGTFLLSAERLKAMGASKIYLLVAHCEKAVYEGKLLRTDLVDGIYTTDTILDEAGSAKINIFPIGGV